jgi:hypothetical protein
MPIFRGTAVFLDQQKLFSYAFYETTYAVMVIIEIGAFWLPMVKKPFSWHSKYAEEFCYWIETTGELPEFSRIMTTMNH